MSAVMHRTHTGIDCYDGARWTDWVPVIDLCHSAGGLASVRQRTPANSVGDNETDVPANPAHVLLFSTLGTPQLDARIAGRAMRRRFDRWDAVYLPPGTDSWWASSPRSAHGIFHLHLDDCMMRTFADAGDAPAGGPMAPSYGFADPVLGGLAQMALAHLEAAVPPQRLIWDTIAAALAFRLLYLAAQRSVVRAANGGLAGWQLRRTTEFLMAHLAEDVALADLAEIAGLSPFHFCRAFKQSTGLPPHAWLTARRIERAQQLMAAHPCMGLTEIALCVGYESQAAFGVAFKRATGVTPGQWRRERAA